MRGLPGAEEMSPSSVVYMCVYAREADSGISVRTVVVVLVVKQARLAHVRLILRSPDLLQLHSLVVIY